MFLSLTLVEPGRAAARDVEVDPARIRTADDLHTTLTDLLATTPGALSVRGLPVAGSDRVGHPPLLHGAQVLLGGPPALPRPSESAVTLRVVGGPDAGHALPLSGRRVVGRGAGCDLRVDDPDLSRTHFSVTVEQTHVRVEDAGSTNGTHRAGRLTSSTVVGAGRSRFRLAPPPAPALDTAPDGQGRLVLEPRLAQPPILGPRHVRRPVSPSPPSRTRVPWVAVLASIPVAGVLALVLGPRMLWFAVLGPLLALTTAAGERWLGRRHHRRELAGYADALARVEAEVSLALTDEASHLDLLVPDPAALLDAATRRSEPLWTRPLSGDERPWIRLGWGSPLSHVYVSDAASPGLDTASSAQRRHREAPVLVDLRAAGALVVRGDARRSRRVIDALLGQLAVLHSPTELTLVVLDEDPQSPWRWLPHRPAHRTAATGADAATQLSVEAQEWESGPTGPTRIVVIPALPTAVDVSALLDRARRAGVLLVLASTRPVPEVAAELDLTALPALLHTGEDTVELIPDEVGWGWVDRLTRSLAPLRPPQWRESADELSNLAEVTGWTPRWAAGLDAGHAGIGADQAVAVVGLTGNRRWEVDLDLDGPHVLLGGTTGSGKSELLRAVVTSLALTLPPEDLSLVLVDYKGGASFGPCADLPHVAGLITDLGPGLASRALQALQAEVARRERVLAEHGITDRTAYLDHVTTLTDRARLARLVIVIDEFRALTQEHPEVLAGIVHLAAVGRSLGVHLILATQRPGGVIGPEIRANVNLRVALRVRDRQDSQDVIEAPDAAALPAAQPGRGLARTGDGDLVPFRVLPVSVPLAAPRPALTFLPSGTVAPRRTHPARPQSARPDPAQPHSAVADPQLPNLTGTPPCAADITAPVAAATTPRTVLDDLIAAITAADTTRAGPRPPAVWLPPLPQTLAWVDLQPGTSAGVHSAAYRPIVGRPETDLAAVALADHPAEQRRSVLRWAPGDGHWLIVGGPRSGRTTALRTVIEAATATLPPGQLHVHVLTTAGSPLAELTGPHIGTVTGPETPRRATALLTRLSGLAADTSRGPVDPETPHVLLAVDDLDTLDGSDPFAPHPLTDRLDQLVAARSPHLTVVAAGGRGAMGGALRRHASTTLVLPLTDPADQALLGLRATAVPSPWPAGRALCQDPARGWSQAQVLQPGGREPRAGPATAYVVEELPTQVSAPTLGIEQGPGLVLGVTGEPAQLLAWDPARDGRRVLVVGGARSGRTTALRRFAHAAHEQGRHLVWIAAKTRPEAGSLPPGTPCLMVDDVATFIATRQAHPGLLVLVDDSELVRDTPVEQALVETARLADRDGGMIIAAVDPMAVSTQFRGLVPALAAYRSGVILTPREPGDGELLGCRRLAPLPDVPGRGYAVRPGSCVEVQVAIDPSGET